MPATATTAQPPRQQCLRAAGQDGLQGDLDSGVLRLQHVAGHTQIIPWKPAAGRIEGFFDLRDPERDDGPARL
jgi:hypothetical protein